MLPRVLGCLWRPQTAKNLFKNAEIGLAPPGASTPGPIRAAPRAHAQGGEAENYENERFRRFLKGFWPFKASRGILGPVATFSKSFNPYGGRTALFRPDLMFSGPGISCSGSPNQSQKPPEAPGSLKSSREAFKLPPEAWPGLAWPCPALAWPCPGPALAWPCPALALPWPCPGRGLPGSWPAPGGQGLALSPWEAEKM